jgi:ATP-dependent Clp protease adapter protein ClpS
MRQMRKLMEAVGQLDVIDQDQDAIIKPSRYVVNLHNCDYTEGTVVAQVLMSVFGLSGEKAFTAMMTAHDHGLSTVASYGSKDVAETKAAQANAKIKQADPDYTEVFQAQKDH